MFMIEITTGNWRMYCVNLGWPAASLRKLMLLPIISIIFSHFQPTVSHTASASLVALDALSTRIPPCFVQLPHISQQNRRC
jgi:hypothetical protein